MDWEKLEQVFDEELWQLIENLDKRDLNSEEAIEIIKGFGNLLFSFDF